MPRPLRWRNVSSLPRVNFFTPVGLPAYPLKEVCLFIEEVEAIRLKDLEGLDQEECAKRMRISRPTFHRVLENARRKLADALLNGKPIRIEGGNFGMATQRFKCDRDGHEWEVPFEKIISGEPLSCPNCHNSDIQPLPPFGFGWGGPGRGWRGGRK